MRVGNAAPCRNPKPARDLLATSFLESIALAFYSVFIDMNTVTLSPKFQVVIPLEVRRELRLHPGEQMRVIRYDDRVELIPVKPIQAVRGLLKGMDTTIEREDERL